MCWTSSQALSLRCATAVEAYVNFKWDLYRGHVPGGGDLAYLLGVGFADGAQRQLRAENVTRTYKRWLDRWIAGWIGPARGSWLHSELATSYVATCYRLRAV